MEPDHPVQDPVNETILIQIISVGDQGRNHQKKIHWQTKHDMCKWNWNSYGHNERHKAQKNVLVENYMYTFHHQTQEKKLRIDA